MARIHMPTGSSPNALARRFLELRCAQPLCCGLAQPYCPHTSTTRTQSPPQPECRLHAATALHAAPLASQVRDMLDSTWAELMLYERVVKNWPLFGPHLEAALCDVLRTIEASLNRICAGASNVPVGQQQQQQQAGGMMAGEQPGGGGGCRHVLVAARAGTPRVWVANTLISNK